MRKPRIECSEFNIWFSTQRDNLTRRLYHVLAVGKVYSSVSANIVSMARRWKSRADILIFVVTFAKDDGGWRRQKFCRRWKNGTNMNCFQTIAFVEGEISDFLLPLHFHLLFCVYLVVPIRLAFETATTTPESCWKLSTEVQNRVLLEHCARILLLSPTGRSCVHVVRWRWKKLIVSPCRAVDLCSHGHHTVLFYDFIRFWAKNKDQQKSRKRCE